MPFASWFAQAFQCGIGTGRDRPHDSVIMKNSRHRRRAAPALCLAFLLPLAGCTDPPAAQGDDLSLLQEAVNTIHRSYVRDVTDDRLVEDALRGMVAGLDPHSAYMDPKEFRNFMSDTRGEFGGIGAELANDGGRVKIIAPIEDTPAAQAGIRPGDIIERVDGKPVDGLNLGEAVEKIRGPAGTTVRLTLSRGSDSRFDLDLKREIIRPAPVKAHLEPGHIGYARITVFNELVQEQLLAAIDKLRQESGGTLAGFVLDLRSDPGGLLDQSVAVTGDFIDGGNVVSVRGRDGKERRRYDAGDHGDRLRGVPMVVIINGASASASEIVAAALQDNHRAKIVGTRSFGKGSVQTITPLGRHGALRLTTDLYFTPSGRSIQGKGVEPDVAVPVPADQRLPIAAMQREADLRNSIETPDAQGNLPTKNTETTSVHAPEGDNGIVDPQIIGTPRDAQLAQAIAQLKKTNVRNDAASGRVP
ncbi:MAG: peptidase [Rhodospirillales bacterium]|nr:peptidase [Rhodospirillales bacterium]